ncbi:MAG: helix-turn-helix domain-containing protein [Burkholderiales bacterium]|nr:helix-turn-helix domain-containing protein [Burkholderiales bacterium]
MAVRDRRSESGLSPEAAAQKLCLSRQQILALENGSSTPFPGKSVRSWCGRRYAALLGLDWDRLVQAPRREEQAAIAESVPATARAVAPEAAPKSKPGRARSRAYVLISGPLAVLAVVIANNMAFTNPSAPVSMPAAKFVAKHTSPVAVRASAVIAPAEDVAPPINPPAVAKAEVAVADRPAEVADQAQTPAASTSAAVETVVDVQGIDAAKQTGSFFVSANEQAVLLKKKRNDPGAGIRIDLAQGAGRRIAIAADEIVRVAEGRDLGIFYQGRKVPARAVDSGAWVHFVRKTSDSAD